LNRLLRLLNYILWLRLDVGRLITLSNIQLTLKIGTNLLLRLTSYIICHNFGRFINTLIGYRSYFINYIITLFFNRFDLNCLNLTNWLLIHLLSFFLQFFFLLMTFNWNSFHLLLFFLKLLLLDCVLTISRINLIDFNTIC